MYSSAPENDFFFSFLLPTSDPNRLFVKKNRSIRIQSVNECVGVCVKERDVEGLQSYFIFFNFCHAIVNELRLNNAKRKLALYFFDNVLVLAKGTNVCEEGRKERSLPSCVCSSPFGQSL